MSARPFLEGSAHGWEDEPVGRRAAMANFGYSETRVAEKLANDRGTLLGRGIDRDPELADTLDAGGAHCPHSCTHPLVATAGLTAFLMAIVALYLLGSWPGGGVAGATLALNSAENRLCVFMMGRPSHRSIHLMPLSQKPAPPQTETGSGERRCAGLVSLRFLRSIWTFYCHCRDRVLDRQRLATLDDRLLTDIGITRWQISREVAKPFWRPVDPREDEQ